MCKGLSLHAFQSNSHQFNRFLLVFQFQSFPNRLRPKSFPDQENGSRVERIKSIGSDPTLQQEVMEILSRHHDEERETLVAEEHLLDREIKRWTHEAKNLIGQINADEVSTLVTSRLAEVQERLAQETPRLAHVRQELARLAEWAIPTETVAKALERFDPLWQAMMMVERQKLLRMLIERIDYDGKQGSVTIVFRPSGLESLLTESLATKETAA